MKNRTRKATKNGKIALFRLALKNRQPLADIKSEIQSIIDATWETPPSELLELFPEGKPTPALFIGILAERARKRDVQPNNQSVYYL